VHRAERWDCLQSPTTSKNQEAATTANKKAKARTKRMQCLKLCSTGMLVRIVSFDGVPMASGIGLLYALSSLKEQGT